jgi:hypothetical protein
MKQARATDPTVTVVASHRVRPGKQAEYRRWQAGIDATAARFPGFVSTELLEPVPEVQPEFVVVFRFADSDALERWLASPERAEWLSRAAPLLSDLHLARIGGGLGGWFLDGHEPRAGSPGVAPRWKQAMAVLLALYPTVMALRWLELPLLDELPDAARVFGSNLLSVAVLTWVLMPLITRGLARWLAPGAGAQLSATYAVGLIAVYATLVAAFWGLMGR